MQTPTDYDPYEREPENGTPNFAPPPPPPPPLFARAKCPLIRMCCVLQCFGGCECVEVKVNVIMGAGMDSLL